MSLALAAASPAAAQTADLPLIPASSMAATVHIIISVPLTEATVDPAFGAALAARFGVDVVAEWPLVSVDVNCFILAAPPGTDVAVLSAALREEADILTAYPVNEFDVLTREYDDELVPIQNGLHQINALRSHARSTGHDVKVAVIDSGVGTDHLDLKDQGLEYRDFVEATPGATVGERHGTAIAALIAADAANRFGMVGIAPDASLLALRACWEEDGEGRCNSFSLARALNFAILNEAEIINLSLGGPEDPLIARLIDAAAAGGAILVAARGPGADPRFPAAHPAVLAAVAAETGRDDGIPAPGLEVLSATENGSFDFFSGDSVAAAHVTGIAALLRAANPELSRDAVVEALAAAADADDPDLVLDACAALTIAAAIAC